MSSATQTSPGHHGYRQKPKWIYFASIVLMLTPFGNLLWSLASLNVQDWYMPSAWAHWVKFVSPTTWFLLAMIFSSGILLLVVRKWTWTLSLACLGVIVVYDIVMIASNQFELMGNFPLILMLLATLSFGLGLYLTEFRKPYLYPRMRWWETSPRFRVDLPIGISSAEHSGNLVDISRSGLLVEWDDPKKTPSLEGELVATLPTQVKIPVVVARQTARGYGLQYGELSTDHKKDIRFFLDTLSDDPTKLLR